MGSSPAYSLRALPRREDARAPLSHFRYPLLAAFAVLLLGAAAASPPDVAASSEPDAADTITTALYPGWNLVGWVGPGTPTSELFDAIPALRQVSAWDAEAQAYQHAVRRRYGDLATLTPGTGLWLRLDGSSTVEWTRAVSDDGVLLSLHAGRNLVGWAGGDGTPVEDAVARLGDTVQRVWAWDSATQQFRSYSPGRVGSRNTLTELSRGDAVWVEVTKPGGWWQRGAANPPFTFLGDVPEQAQAGILAEFDAVQAFFAVRFAAVGRGRHQYIGTTVDDISTIYRAVFGGQPRSTAFCGRTDFVSVAVYVLGCVKNLQAANYIEALMLEIPGKGSSPGGRQGLDPRGPSWLIVGTNEYAKVSYQEATDPYFSYAMNRDYHRGQASRTELSLREFHVFEEHSGPVSAAGRSLGFLAAEWLAKRAGDPSLFEYLRLMRDTNDWQQSFETAFGISSDDLYEAFAAYRAHAFAPPAHLTDDKAEAVLVVLDGVPSGAASAIRAEFEGVREFFDDRFGVEATEFTLYIASNAQEALAAVPGWYAVDVCRHWPQSGIVVLSLQWCGDFLGLDYVYAGAVIQELAYKLPPASGSVRGRAPKWFEDGVVAYAEVAYGEAAGTLTPGEFRDLAVAAAIHNPVTLEDLAGLSGARAAGTWPTKALGFLAVEWLADRAGDRAVFRYYRLLPEATSREEAFSRAFQISFDNLYEQFEAYRETLTAR